MSSSPETRYEEARLTRQMVTRVERFLAGAATREELWHWARSTRNKGAPLRFRYGHADSLHTLLWNLDERLAGTDELLVRSADLAAQLHDVCTGTLHIAPNEVALLKLPIAEIVRRTGIPEVRYPFAGLGWFECVRFASLGTGISWSPRSPGTPRP